MTPRVLDKSEWLTKLVNTELEAAVKYLPPQTIVLVIEDDATGEVLGSWATMTYRHVEGLHIAPAHRKKGVVAGKLVVAMRTALQHLNCEVVLTAALTDEVRMLIERAGGQRLPGDHYAVPVGGL